MTRDAEKWAAQVLYVVGDRSVAVGRMQLAIEPGGFRHRLIDAALAADVENLARIGRGFPDLAQVVALYREHGPLVLAEIAEGATNWFAKFPPVEPDGCAGLECPGCPACVFS